MSIFTNACGNIRKYANESETGFNPNTAAELLYKMDKNYVPAKKKPAYEDMGRVAKPAYLIRERIDDYKKQAAELEAAVAEANLRVSDRDVELARRQAEHEASLANLQQQLGESSASNKTLAGQLREAKSQIAGLEGTVSEQQRKAKEVEAADKAFKGSNKALLKQVWGNTKDYANSKYRDAENFLKAKYNEDPEFYNRLALMSGGALGGAGLGALIAGRNRRILGALGGAAVGGGAGALAHYLANKYGYMA